jgi:hypothetical protein
VVPRISIPVDAATKTALLHTFAPGADDGQVFYSNSRTFWVEPVTGEIVGYREQPRRELVPSDGGTVVLLDATFTYTPDTTAAAVAYARDGREQILALAVYGPLVIGLIGLAMAVFALVLGLRRRRARRRAAAAGASDVDESDAAGQDSAAQPDGLEAADPAAMPTEPDRLEPDGPEPWPGGAGSWHDSDSSQPAAQRPTSP